MGADTFVDRVAGPTAKEAFRTAVEEAQYDHGHSGYTGTIAEKSNFKMISCPESIRPEDYAQQLIDGSDPRIDDKWGPAGCIDCSNGEYLFFGWASS